MAMRPKRWDDPATVVALAAFLLSGGLIVIDGLDEALLGIDVSFGYWPYVLMSFAAFWFFGIRLGGPGNDKGG